MPPFLNVPKDFLALPLVGTDCIVIFRQSDFTRPLILTYANFVAAISAAISGGGTSALLLQTNGTNNPVQTLLNLVEGSGITITDDGAGNITFTATGGGSVTADNGLTETAGNVQLGGTLLQNTTIDATGSYTLLVTGARASYLDVMQIINTGDGNALYVEALKGYAIYGYNSLNWAANFETDQGVALLLRTKQSPLNNNVQTLLQLSRSTNAGVGANGLGSSIDFEAETTLGVVMQLQARIIAAWTSATYATRTASLLFYTTNNGVSSKKLIINGAGQIKLEQYGTGAFSGTVAYSLGVDASGNVIEFIGGGTGTVTNVAATVPSPTSPALSVAVTNPTTTPSIDITANGAISQYIRGDGSLAPFPSVSGGGASLSYYLNGSVAQGTLGGVAFKQMSNIPVIGAGTDFTINADGYIQSFITDASVPNQLLIPAGNWNFEMYFSSSSAGGSPSFYIELYKLSGGVLTLIASSSATPEFITNGTAIDLYTTALAVPSTVLLAADRLAIRVYVTHSSKTIKLHTEDSHLCQVITTFSTGITALNGLTDQVQSFAVGTSGTDFAISSVSPTHTFNLPTASAANRGALSTTDWSTFNGKQNLLTTTKSVKVISDNVELENDETAPLARKFYSTSGAAARGWRYIEALDLPVAVQNASYPYTAQEYVTGGNAILKVAGANILFVATGNTVLSIDSVTGETLFTTAVTGASGLVYVAQTNQVWAFGSLALVYRFTPSTGAFVASNAVLLLTASCKAIYDDSAVSGNVYAYQASTMNIINHATYARTAVASGTGNTAQELVKVTGGAQVGLLVGGCANGIFAFNPSTNLFVYGPGAGVGANFVKYVPSIDRFVTSAFGSNFLLLVQPTSSTTLSIVATLRGVQAPYQFIVDESVNRVFALGGPAGGGQMRVSVLELSASALTWVKSDVLSQTTSNGSAYASHDLANKTFYAAGNTSAKIVYG